jgi:putative nucleotidyltransferase with HDIG domain
MLKEHRVPSHIVAHSLAVAKLAVFLAERLKEKGVPVDVALVDRACLLHDIFRICELKKTEAHEDAAYNLLKERYPVLALAVKKHRYSALLDEKERPTTWEEKLVYYADKRVMHDRIVPLKERLEEAHKRNAPQNDIVRLPEKERHFLSFPRRRESRKLLKKRSLSVRWQVTTLKARRRIDTAKIDRLIYKLEKEIFNKIGLPCVPYKSQTLS